VRVQLDNLYQFGYTSDMKTELEKAQMKELYQKAKVEFIKYLGGQCVACGSVENLEFDHIDWRTKEFTIAAKWGMKDKAKLFAELDKCQLLCKICHKVKTKVDQAEQKTKPLKHGTMYAWMNKKCHCDICDVARQIWYKDRNAKRRVKESARGPYNQPADHGDFIMYKRGCKCDLCRAANTAKARERRNK